MTPNDPVSALLVIKEPTLNHRLGSTLACNRRLRIKSCSTAGEAMARLRNQPFEILYTDLWLDDMPGIDLIHKARQGFPQITIIAGASTGTAKDVMAAMQAGASDVIIDPYTTELLEHALEKVVRDLMDKPSPTVRQYPDKAFITQDRSALAMLDVAKKVAPSTATVLITGESGTGKELLAAFVHAHSNRCGEPYVAVNCAALPEQLAESELFGHEKGAFTGAISRKIGQFESASKGTLVLDEITEMALPLQAKLLRALQEKEIVRLGSNRAISIHSRVIAVSNRNVQKSVREGDFREDLFYRLNVIPLTIPPLRERKSDIPLLAEYFLERFSRINEKEMNRISDQVLELLLRHPWPGNVRELENTIQRGVLIGDGKILLPEHLILEENCPDASRWSSPVAGMTVREMEKELIFNTLEEVNDNRTHAARMLGISIRTLRNKLNDYRSETQASAV